MILGIDISRANVKKRTGVEHYVFTLTNQLKQIIPSDVRVVLYSREPLVEDLLPIPENWEVKVLAWKPKKLWTQIRLSYEMLFHAPDVLFIPGHVFPIIRPKKTIMTIHDIAAFRFPHAYSKFEQWYSLWSAKKAVTTLAKVIVPSNFTKTELEKFVYNKVNNKKIETNIVPIHLGFEKSTKKIYSKSEIETKIGIFKPYMLYVGRKEEKKNIKAIVESFNKIKQKDIDIQLVLVGKQGFGYNQIKDVIKNSKYVSDIIEPGFVSNKEVHSLYKYAELFIFPSVYEGFGFPVLEAMAADCPVVCSKGSSLPEIAEDAAKYVDHTSIKDIYRTIIKVLENKNLQRKLMLLGKQQYKKFSWQDTANKTWQVIKDVYES